MGGGYGVAGNGQNIIVDETTRFAMPETAIGFFPDVGIGWKLARAGALGMYIALTGDVFDADALCCLSRESGNLFHVIDKRSLPSQGIQSFAEINEHFSKNTLKDIFQSLENDKSDFAKTTLETLKKRCPLSLHITFLHLKMAENEDYDTAIARDYWLACAFFNGTEVYEGIRAQLIDKDKNPQWAHESINNVPQEVIDYYMQFGNTMG
jgi:enoyl-CoA hydratase